MERSADRRIHTTQWEDAQYKYGNRVGKYATQELEILAQKIADQHQNTCLEAYDPEAERRAAKLARGGVDSDDEQEAPRAQAAASDEDDDEEDALAAIRRRRVMEMQKQQSAERFGVLRHVSGADYVKEVTDSSADNWVIDVLMKPNHGDSESLLSVLRTVAQRNRTVKFVSMISTEAIPNFPDRHLPCVLMYNKKELVKQVTGLEVWSNQKQLNVSTAEGFLRRSGVLPGEDGEEVRAAPERKVREEVDSDSSDE